MMILKYNKMKLYRIVLGTLLFPLFFISCSQKYQEAKDNNRKLDEVQHRSTTDKEDDVVKILAIGNSFSQDAIESYLYELANAAGKKLVIGNLYIGGASLSDHQKSVEENLSRYDYRKIELTGQKTNTPKTSIDSALKDEDWDFISFQQVSSYSGKYDSFLKPLPIVFNYVKERVTNPDVKYILHQTWAYEQTSTHKGFALYNQDQMAMYRAIINAVGKAKDIVPIDMIVPAGTAIQNARTSWVGDHLTRDGYHLDLTIGRYTAACTWFEAIFETNVVGNSFKPDALSEEEAKLAQNAAHFATLKPNEVTDLVIFKNKLPVQN